MLVAGTDDVLPDDSALLAQAAPTAAEVTSGGAATVPEPVELVRLDPTQLLEDRQNNPLL